MQNLSGLSTGHSPNSPVRNFRERKVFLPRHHQYTGLGSHMRIESELEKIISSSWGAKRLGALDQWRIAQESKGKCEMYHLTVLQLGHGTARVKYVSPLASKIDAYTGPIACTGRLKSRSRNMLQLPKRVHHRSILNVVSCGRQI